MDRLRCMQVFVRVVEAGSFAAAAEQCRISATMVGKHVAYLEQRLGACLLNRTTRRQSLSEVGKIYYERCKHALAEVEAAEACAGELHQAPRGVLRVNAPLSFGAHALTAAIGDYLQRHPQMQIELALNDRVVNLVDEGYEVALRIGSLPDSSLIARPLRPYRMVACAAPRYLAEHGVPQTPAQLGRHNCLGFAYSVARKHWQFIDDDGAREVAVSGNFRVNNGQALRTAALHGMGIIVQPEVLLEDDLAAGRLLRVLPGHALPSQAMHLVYPSQRNMRATLNTFVEFMVERFGPR
ncbi:MAG: LysR family transcriptional regulator [Pseudomonadota bacterium]